METIVSRGAPGAQTPGVVGDLYVDMDTNKVYRCLNVVTAGSEMGFVKVTAYHIGNRTYEWGLLELSDDPILPDEPEVPDEPETPDEPEEPAVTWLFEDEEIVAREGRTDLPAPVEGELYTVFVDGVEGGTALCYQNAVSLTMPDGHSVRYSVRNGWEGHKDFTFTVSIRCNGSAIPEDPFNNPEAVWLFKNEEFTEDRTDLPSPEVDKYYVLYVDGVASGIYKAGTDKGSAYVVWNVNETGFYHQVGQWRSYSPERMYPATISVLELAI